MMLQNVCVQQHKEFGLRYMAGNQTTTLSEARICDIFRLNISGLHH